MKRRVSGVKEKSCIVCKKRFIGKIEDTGKVCSSVCRDRNKADIAFPLPAGPVTTMKAKNIKKLLRKNKRKAAIKALLKENAALRKGIVPKPEKKKSFYLTDEWRQLRYQVIKAHKRTCMACGTTSKEIHVDHIKPRSKFPELELDLSNLQLLCVDCNIGKSNIDSTDWRQS